MNIGMTQVCQHYAHTFEKFKFHFHYESDLTFDRLAQFICSKNVCAPKMEKIARSVLNLLKRSYSMFVFFLFFLLFSFDWHISKTRQNAWVKLYIMIGIHDRSCKSILIFLKTIMFTCKQQKNYKILQEFSLGQTL